MKVTRVPPCPLCSLSGRACPGPSALRQQVWALAGGVDFCPHHMVRGASVLDRCVRVGAQAFCVPGPWVPGALSQARSLLLSAKCWLVT